VQLAVTLVLILVATAALEQQYLFQVHQLLMLVEVVVMDKLLEVLVVQVLVETAHKLLAV
jgi:hypothetical protein